MAYRNKGLKKRILYRLTAGALIFSVNAGIAAPALAESTTVLGDGAEAEAGATVLGDSAYGNGYSVVIGNGAYSSYTVDGEDGYGGSVVIGRDSTSYSDCSVVIGHDLNLAEGASRSTIVGGHTMTYTGDYNVVIGRYGDDSQDADSEDNTEDASYTTSLGYNAKATEDSATALGYKAEANYENSVALGANSSASGEYVVSVGDVSSGLTRTIEAVSDGEISEDSTEAVNGSQLYSVIEDFDGQIDDIEEDLDELDEAIDSASWTISVNDGKSKTEIVNGDTLTVNAGDNIEITSTGTAEYEISVTDSPEFESVTVNADLTVSGAASLGGGLAVTGDTSINGTLDMNDNEIINVSNLDADDVAVSDSLTVTGAAALNGGLSVAGDTSIDGTLDMNGNKVTGVSDGEIAEDSTDAVNGSQLYSAVEDLDGAIASASWTLSVNDGESSAEVVNGDTLTVNAGDNIEITSTGTAEYEISVTDNPEFESVTVNADLTVSGEASLGGGLAVAGDASISGTLDMNDNEIINVSNLDASDVTVSNSLTVTGPTVLNGGLSVVGDASISGTLDMNDNEIINVSNLDAEDVTVNDSLTVGGATILNGGLSVVGDTSIDGTLDMNNNEIINVSNLSADDVTVNDSLTVAGPTVLNGGLGVVGDTSINGTLDMNNNEIVNVSNLDAADVTVSDSLTVSGPTALNGGLSVVGDASINGTLDMNGNKVTGVADGEISDESTEAINGRQFNSVLTGKTAFSKLTVTGPASFASGADFGGNKLTGVADGDVSSGSTDAVNGGQLYSASRGLTEDIKQVGAHAAALASIKPLEYDPFAPTSFSVGVGSYRGETAAAIGATHYFNRDVALNVGGTVGNKSNMFNTSLSVRLGRGGREALSNKSERKKVTLAKEEQEKNKERIVYLENARTEDAELISAMRKEIEELKNIVLASSGGISRGEKNKPVKAPQSGGKDALSSSKKSKAPKETLIGEDELDMATLKMAALNKQ